MKKRLLITSIVMMLVVAVALSTATYAWFTSNAKVEASNISISAQTSNAPSLAIAWGAAEPTFGTALTSINAPAAFYPIAPATLDIEGDDQSLASQNYYSATIRTEGQATFNAAGLATWAEGSAANNATPYYLSTGSGENEIKTIILKNNSTVTNMSAVTISADITGSAAKLVRIAVYKSDGEQTPTYKLVDVLGYNYTYTAAVENAFDNTKTYYEKDAHNHYVVKSIANAEAYAAALSNLYTRDADPSNTAAGATYGTISGNNTTVASMSSYSCKTSFSVGALSATATMELKVVIWLDGLALDDETQGFDGTINLSFSATSANA